MDERVTVMSTKLVRQLKQRNRLRDKHKRYCDTITAVLQAVSPKRSKCCGVVCPQSSWRVLKTLLRKNCILRHHVSQRNSHNRDKPCMFEVQRSMQHLNISAQCRRAILFVFVLLSPVGLCLLFLCDQIFLSK